MPDVLDSVREASAAVDASTSDPARQPTTDRWRCTDCEAHLLFIYRRRFGGSCATCGGTSLEAVV